MATGLCFANDADIGLFFMHKKDDPESPDEAFRPLFNCHNKSARILKIIYSIQSILCIAYTTKHNDILSSVY